MSVKLDLKPGDEFISWDFTSTSLDGSQGFRFAGNNGTYESILDGCGVDVSELSVHEHGPAAGEREVLVLPGARFRVKDIFRPDPRRRPQFYHVLLERRLRLLQHDDHGRAGDDVGDADWDAPLLQLAVPVDVKLAVVDGVGDADWDAAALHVPVLVDD